MRCRAQPKQTKLRSTHGLNSQLSIALSTSRHDGVQMMTKPIFSALKCHVNPLRVAPSLSPVGSQLHCERKHLYFISIFRSSSTKFVSFCRFAFFG
eukprot:m.176810 g.176810  ORF g.176810 m.176810 type:complete len:96 (+) comp14904_c0_seq2:14871-15158(+)